MKKLMLFVLMLGLGTMIMAQSEDLKPKKYENSTWHQHVLVKYKAGKVGEAKKLIEKFKSASETAGTPMPEQYWFLSGSYDMLLVWNLEGGPSDLEWQWDENGIKWWNAFVEQEGSKEAAEKVQDDYDALVSGSMKHILRKDN